MGRTFQIERPFEDLTVLENVLIGAFMNTASRTEAERVALEKLAIVGLDERANQPASDLNLARRRRLELARRSEEHTSELQSRGHLVCRLLREKKKNRTIK